MTSPPEKKESAPKTQQVKRIAIIRLKGTTGLKPDVRETLKLLRLYKKHTAIVVPSTPAYIGMIDRIKETVTWGEIDSATCKLLLEKRGRLPGKQSITPAYIKEKSKLDLDAFVNEFMAVKKELKDIPGLKPFFKLMPPAKGFEKKGLKAQFSMGGSLGYRKHLINELLQRMI